MDFDAFGFSVFIAVIIAVFATFAYFGITDDDELSIIYVPTVEEVDSGAYKPVVGHRLTYFTDNPNEKVLRVAHNQLPREYRDKSIKYVNVCYDVFLTLDNSYFGEKCYKASMLVEGNAIESIKFRTGSEEYYAKNGRLNAIYMTLDRQEAHDLGNQGYAVLYNGHDGDQYFTPANSTAAADSSANASDRSAIIQDSLADIVRLEQMKQDSSSRVATARALASLGFAFEADSIPVTTPVPVAPDSTE